MLKMKSKSKTITRRLVSILAIIIAFAMALSGCGDKETGDADTTDTPKIAYYAYFSEPILDWDPSVEFSSGTIVLNNIYETLLRYNPEEDSFEPILATEYTHSEDGMLWTFTLREGVKFHDGTVMDAEAVKFSIDRTINLGKGASYVWDAVKEIRVVEPYKVEFELKYPAPIDLISSCCYSSFIMSPTAVNEDYENWAAGGKEAGTGPYMLQSTKMGEEVILTQFPDYWGGWEGEHFSKVLIKKVPETASRRQMVETGEADVTVELPYEDVQALSGVEAVNINRAASFNNLTVFMNNLKEPLNDVKVRQALSYAFPYEDVIKYAMGDYAKQSKGPVPAGLWGHGKDLPQYETDLEKARTLLAEAGYADGFKLLLTYMSGDEAEKKSAELFKSELNKIGVDLEIRAMPWESQWELSRHTDPNERQDMMMMYWWPDYASPYSYLYNMFHSEEEPMYNLSYYSNETFDNMIDEANVLSASDRVKAEEMFIEAQEILIEEAAAIFAYDKEFVWVTNSSFAGLNNNPVYPNVVFFYDTYRTK
mgnify:CR=1 FL=1